MIIGYRRSLHVSIASKAIATALAAVILIPGLYPRPLQKALAALPAGSVALGK